MIKNYIEQAIRNLEAEKAQKIGEAESRVLAGKVAQYYGEADKKRDAEVSELTISYNEAVSELQKKYSNDKQVILDKYAADKLAYKENAVLSETSTLAYEYDKHIAKLQEMIKE